MLIATDTHVYVHSSYSAAPKALYEDGGIQRIARRGDAAVIALKGGDLVVIDPGGTRRMATGVPEEVAALLALSTDPLNLLIGVDDGAFVYRLQGDGPAERVESFDALACRSDWYTPWGGPPAVRAFAASMDGWVYADIHVGSIMRSPDEGETWEPVTPDLHVDVHEVATSPVDAGRLYANTADAVFISDDRGTTWVHRPDGLSARYGRAIATHPADRDVVLASVSNGPGGGDARLYRTEDAGMTWAHVADGFPASCEKNIDTYQVAFTPDGTAWAAVGSTLYSGRDGGAEWDAVWEAPDAIRMLTA
ncbi:hypothetical protein CMK11_18500 [Candidatus Poribacteria bacterium]|nr:hypothetical protein [Candidatus Poribacteria bacterium]